MSDAYTPIDQKSSAVPSDGLGQAQSVEPAVASEPQRSCWRCGQHAPEAGECPACGACALPGNQLTPPLLARTRAGALQTVIVAYAMMLGVAALVGGVAMMLDSDRDKFAARKLIETTAPQVVLDVIWTAIVAVAIWVIPRPVVLPERRLLTRIGWWLFSLPALMVALLINMKYHQLLHEFVRVDWFFDLGPIETPGTGVLLYAVVSICIQPAIIEELFFRNAVLGTLRVHTGDHAAVWVSAVMFGFAHIFVPLSIPVLILIGVMLGYVRLWTRSLALPMLLHALHNGAILWLELNDSLVS